MTTLSPTPNAMPHWTFTRVLGRCVLGGFLICLLLVISSKTLGDVRAARYLVTRFDYPYQFAFQDLETRISWTTQESQYFMLSASMCQLMINFSEQNYLNDFRVFDLQRSGVFSVDFPDTQREFLHPSWNPQNTKLSFSVGADTYVATLPEETVHVIGDAKSRSNSDSHSISPDFNYMLKRSAQDGLHQSYLINLKTQQETLIYQANSDEFIYSDTPRWTWSANERYVLGAAYTHQSAAQPYILYDVSEDVLRTLTIPVSEDIIWSPDNQKMLFVSQHAGGKTLYLYDIAQASHIQLAHIVNETADLRLQWSPDGKKILLYHSRIKHIPQIFDADTGQMIPIQIPPIAIDDGRRSQPVSWSPDSRWLLLKSSGEVGLYAVDTLNSSFHPLEIRPFDIPAWHQNNAFYYLALEGDDYMLNLASLAEDGTLTITEKHPYSQNQTWAWVCDEAL